MKKLLLWGLFTTMFFGITVAQDIVTTRPQKKAVVLEEYTGINCPACPYGHAAAEALVSDNLGKVFIINVHNGYYATPSDGQPDFRTQWGSALEGQTGLGGYPSATINRYLFADLSEEGGTALYRDVWPAASDIIFAESSPVNIGISTVYNDVIREVEITVEAYFVEGLPFGVSSNFLQVAILESDVVGYQEGEGYSYIHNHILRDLVTGQWGEELEAIEAGTLITRTYTYIIDEEYVVENCSVVVFITETRQEVITGAEVPVVDGVHNGEIEADYGRLFVDNSLESGLEGQVSSFDVTLINGLNEIQDVSLILSHNAPEDWDVSFSVNEVIYTESVSLSLSPDEVKDVVINVTPGITVGVAQCELILTSESYPSEPEKIAEVFVFSSADNLIVNGSGTNNSIVSSDYESNYIIALTEAGCNSIGSIPGYTLEQAADLGLLENVKSIYLNIGGSEPVLTVGQANVLEDFIDNGGNLMVAGQDFGRDIYGSNAESGAITQKLFYQNYLSSSFLNDGDSDNNEVSSASDSVYSGVSNVVLFNAYGTSFDPDDIKEYDEAKAVLYYPSGKAAAVKSYRGSARIVYFAFGLEQVQDDDARNDLLDRTYRWFEGWEGSNVLSQVLTNIEIYPNPATDILKIVNSEGDYTFRVINMAGQLVDEGIVKDEIDISSLNSGIYFVELQNKKGIARIRFTKM
jgi:hypothetical protein